MALCLGHLRKKRLLLQFLAKIQQLTQNKVINNDLFLDNS
jgi:hypothetical protein